MIECSNEFVYYKRKNRKKSFKRFFSFLLILTIIFFCVIYYKKVVISNLNDVCVEKTQAISVICINKAILTSFSEPIDYYDLIKVEKNSNGDIVMISSNSQKLNQLSRSLTENATIKLQEEIKKGIKLPFLAFSGISFLSGYGKEVNFKALTVENVSCDFVSKFSSVGINQTLHGIYVDIKSEIILEFPLDKKVKTFSTNVLLSETVLIGKVPEVYLSGSTLS